MKKALVILLLVTLVLSKQFDSYVLTNDEKLVTKEADLNTSDLINVLKHNFGSLVSEPSEKAMKFIKDTGKTAINILNPIKANFLVLINGNLDKKSQEKIVGKSTMKTTLDMENVGSNHLFDQIFNTENAQSLINTVYKFSDELKRKEFYLFSQDKNFSNYFENFGISIAVDEQGNVVVEDKQVREFHNREKFQKCVKKSIDGQYKYDASQNTITNISTNETLIIDSSNATEMRAFLSELCGMHMIATAFKKDIASFLALEVNSLPKIQKVLTPEKYAIAQDVLAVALKKVISHYEKTHKNSNFGQVIFAQSEDSTYLVSEQSKNMKVRLLTAAALTPAQVTEAQNYTLRAWFSIFFVALVFFVCYALFSTEITKDSLLYAKFIAEERR